MGFNCGIVGLPNVGKSTLFNALTNTIQAESANYPFCTIEPNVGRVAVPDGRLEKISAIVKPEKTIPTYLEFVDIAGLVKGASKGEGLGNQFLANIRDVDAVIHLVRCFENENITHVEGSLDPIRDIETIETELMLADLESLERRIEPLEKKIRGGAKDAKDIRMEYDLMNRALEALRAGNPARTVERSKEEEKTFRTLHLLSAKPVLYVCNVNEEDAASGNQYTETVDQHAAGEGAQMVVISAAIEAEVSQLDSEEEKRDFLSSMGLEQTGLSQVIQAGYRMLDLITFFTAGPKEARAWTIKRGTRAPAAAGTIHSDFEKGFIVAETIAFDDFVTLGGEQACKDAGKMRQEGRDYEVHDGDIMHFRFNV